MGKFSGPEDVYDQLVENSEESWILGLVAFAIIEEQRIEWIKHQVEHTGRTPDADEIKSWYEQQPRGVLLRARDTAEARLKDYSSAIVEEVLAASKTAKSAAGSALSQRKAPNKATATRAGSAASITLRSSRSSKSARSSAGSALAQRLTSKK